MTLHSCFSWQWGCHLPLRPLFGLAPFWKQCSPGVTLPAERGGPGPLPRTFQWLRAGGREGPLVPRSAIDAHGAHGAFVGLGRVRWGFALLLLHLHFPWSVPDRPTRRPWSPPSLTLCLSASGLPASLWPKATVAGRLAPLCASHSAAVAEAARPEPLTRRPAARSSLRPGCTQPLRASSFTGLRAVSRGALGVAGRFTFPSLFHLGRFSSH